MGGILLLRSKESETICDELTTNPVPCLLVLLWKEGSREFGNKVKSRKKGKWREGVSRIWFYFS